MLVKELTKLTELDQKISRLQQELAGLYKERFLLVDPSQELSQSADWPVVTPQSTTHPADAWVTVEYQKLHDAWQRYGIAIPAVEFLESKLRQARHVMQELAEHDGRLHGNLSLLLVPPTAQVGWPVKPALRARQGQPGCRDLVNSELATPGSQRKWRLLVVYSAPAGLHLEAHQKPGNLQAFLLGKHDSRALGLYEYAALSLQVTQPLDTTTWTSLLKPRTGHNQLEVIPYAGLRDGVYRFDINDMYGIFGDDRYRPAVEIH